MRSVCGGRGNSAVNRTPHVKSGTWDQKNKLEVKTGLTDPIPKKREKRGKEKKGEIIGITNRTKGPEKGGVKGRKIPYA